MGKKRKKKVYTTPKKVKGDKKVYKLKIIETMKNKIRCKNCNNLMANHENRITCTYCGTSEFKSEINNQLHS